MKFHHRQGWSAVLRIVDATREEPVADATLLLKPTPGYGDGPSLSGRSSASGLATFSGIGFELAEALVQHDALLPAQAPAVSATAGSFAFRRIELEAGGELSAVVRIDGEPVAGVRCALRSPSPDERELWSEVVAGETDDEGRFGAAPLAGGSYSLWIEPPSDEGDQPTGTLTAVWIESGSTTSVDVDLKRLEITGRVRVQGEPASGHGVRISQMTTGSETRLENIGSTTTDEDGRYELSVWKTGEYFLWVSDAQERFLETDRIWAGDHGATRDFDITKQHLQGRVVDTAGRPASGARVGVFFKRSKMRTIGTDDEGRFEFAFNGGGTVELDAFLDGHAKSEQVVVEVPEKGVVAPVVLRLGGRQGLRGTVTLHGTPAAGVRVAAYRPGGGEVPEGVGSAVTAADGGFVLPAAANAAGQPLRFFLSGPGCPLSIRDAVPDDNQTVALACAENAGHLLLHLRDGEGKPRPGTQLTLAASKVAVPHTVLSAHLASLGLPTVTTGAGELVAAALEAGSWEVFLGQGANAATIARGEVFGFLTAAQLSAGSTVELDLTLE
ncbi:MAG TPA: carboxypeptidase regulatory-like domain-containing protein [Thermoanaerobaculia bacterium]|nr:carboxypeptidase regulatory-like domain-containing protein [Thermoanaerobaculia bacterium]